MTFMSRLRGSRPTPARDLGVLLLLVFGGILAVCAVVAGIYYGVFWGLAWVWNTSIPLFWAGAPHLRPLQVAALLIAASVALAIIGAIGHLFARIIRALGR